MQSLVNDVHHLSTKIGEEDRQRAMSHVCQAQSSVSQLAMMLAGSEAGLLAGYDGYTVQVAIEVFSKWPTKQPTISGKKNLGKLNSR